MKAVILAGGMGTRISEESHLRPKPMIEIGGRPIIWHIMKIYSAYGINDFIICLGYRGYMIKEYFANYFLHMSDVTVDLKRNQMEFHQVKAEPWRVTLIDTGEATLTGGRLKRVRDHLDDDDFLMTYGDGVANIDMAKLISFHRAHGKLATVTAVRPQARYGALTIEETQVLGFEEKPLGDGRWINGGFFVLSPKCLDYIADDSTTWELEPMRKLVSTRQIHAYQHHDFWQPMDTLRDKTRLEQLWMNGNAPWKIWA